MDLDRGREKAVLVGLLLPRQSETDIEFSLDELAELTKTAGAEVIGRSYQARDKPHKRTFIGPGKADELAERLRGVEHGMLIFDDQLTPSQQLNLENLTNCKVIDRTGLILDIFAQHAASAAGKIQVELAQLNYYLPRLKGLGIEMSRLGGGIGTRGPGETKLETDRRRLRRRIQQLKKQLESLAKVRDIQRRRRQKSGIYNISLVGYTNAGKSSMLRCLTGVKVLVADKLFATLDSAARRLVLPGGREVVLSDTVGFINKLPHELVAAFKSTLSEAAQADLLLHVINAADPRRERQIRVVNSILKELGLAEKVRLNLYNKADLITPAERRELNRRKQALAVSAITGLGIGRLRRRLDKLAGRSYREVRIKIPYQRGDIRRAVFKRGLVVGEEPLTDAVIITVQLRPDDAAEFSAYILSE